MEKNESDSNIEHSVRRSSHEKMSNWESMGEMLLDEKLILTALELYSELNEKNIKVKCLQEYFNNPLNFIKLEDDKLNEYCIEKKKENVSYSESDSNLEITDSIQDVNLETPSLYSFNSVNFDSRKDKHKISLLEYELRKSRETIKTLRKCVTNDLKKNCEISENASRESSLSRKTIQNHSENYKSCEAIDNNDVVDKAIAFLLYQYLINNHCDLSAVTFCEECEFDIPLKWIDIGINIKCPPNINAILQNYIATKYSN
ncbi:hypothetical protein A3Q56_06307 [Intoshia linei]|uniref:LisH domain-containing protein n=1 Tax=Intoshia linei TaxID=1819745 RepID=A0A177AWU8_9BILA|nr:hypothetical protein A3Q56_06307 [Intoshia linei]